MQLFGREIPVEALWNRVSGHPWTRRVTDFWEQRNPRERKLLALMGALLGVYLGFWSVSHWPTHTAEASLADLEQEYSQARRLNAEFTRYRAALGQTEGQTLTQVTQALLRKLGLAARGQADALPGQPGETEHLELRADDLSLDETVYLVYALEDRGIIESVDISPSQKASDSLKVVIRARGG